MALTKLFTKKERITQLFWKNPAMYAKFWLKGHNGVDFWVPVGTPVLACLDGYAEAGYDKAWYGNYVKIFKNRPDGISEVIYWHFSETHVKSGDVVKSGQVIGKSGNTWNSTWPHLHFWLRFRDLNKNIVGTTNGFKWWIDPMPYFE